ncbi:MAG: Gfo/Idh/MocA family oxidoreductase [Gemmatimonadaceae bacterium]|nr:Gfo/Idh/MocA family oxidoreductase [Gemmatimonadaceae bacterium]
MPRKKVTRREFVAKSGAATVSALFAAKGFPAIVPRHVLGGPGYTAPSDTVNFAVAGFGGMGSGNAQELARTEKLAAVCDVDLAFARSNVESKLRPGRDGQVRPEAVKLGEQFERAAKYTDFREMLEKEKGIDGVVIATPDHAHAVIAKAAMDLGKHVYVQKPLTWSVREARALRAAAAANPKIITQMGNQGHSSDGARRINEWIAAGVIGAVREVHVWTNRPVGYWPQGVPRPDPAALTGPGAPRYGTGWSQGRINTTIAADMGANAAAMPDGLRWDLFLGPVAEDIAYHPVYHPFNWRGWVDFGMGALGDMGAHLIDHPYWALNLDLPVSIEATSTAFGMATLPPLDPTAPSSTPAGRPRQVPASYPLATTVHYQFAARGSMPPVKLFWFDGGLYPPRPDLLPDGEVLKGEGGVIFHGERGILMNDTYGANPRCYPESAQVAADAVPRTIPRIEWSHELNWAKAIRGEATASSPFDYSAKLTETMLLGVAALRAGQGRKVYYDGAKGEFVSAPEANQYLTRVYRAGWGV